MADYRQIHTSIWDDAWYCRLSSDEKIVFIWLFSNRRASVSGLYKFTEFICARETGLSAEAVSSAIIKLSADNKICVEGEWVWVKNLRKYNDSKSPNANKRIDNDLSQLPDNGLKKAYMDYYKPLASPLQAPTHGLLEQEQEQEKEQEHEQEQEREEIGARAAEPEDKFDDLQHAIEQVIGMPQGVDAVKTINELIAVGAEANDIRDAASWYRSQNKTIRSAGQLLGPAKEAIRRRKQAANIPIRAKGGLSAVELMLQEVMNGG